MNKFNVALVVFGSITLVPCTTYALPDFTKDISGLTSKVSTVGVGSLIGDSEDLRSVYVLPGNLKFKGKFYQTAGGADCQDIYNLRKNTFKMPAEEEFKSVIDENRFYSPAFESSIGVAAKNLDITKKMIDAKAKVGSYIEEHREIYGAYKKSKATLDLLKNDIATVEASIQMRTSQLTTDIVLADSVDERKKLRYEFRKDFAGLQYSKSELLSHKVKALRQYGEALEDWAPYRDELEWLEKVEDNLVTSFSRIQQIADASLERSKRLINVLESKIIGFASAGYSITPDKQVEILNDRIRETGLNYSAKKLDVFNVRLNPGVTKTVNTVKNNTQKLDYELVTYNFPKNTKLLLNTKERWVDVPLTIEENGNEKRIKFLMSDLEGGFGGSQSFEVPVTHGARCGYAKTNLRKFKYADTNGRKFSRTVSVVKYDSPAANQPVFVQNVALRYNYYQKAEQISGQCSMSVNKSSSYIRNAGRKTSWSWFKKSTHTWDDTKKSLSNNMGLTCTLKKRPVGKNPVESKMINDAFEKALYQDIFNMFLITYAKEYTITPIRPELLSSESKLFSKMGDAIMNLCGSNKYCLIGSIVLKSMDELAGKRHTGTTSNVTTMNGTLRRNMDIDGYKIAEGHTNIEMRVCLDQQNCEE